MENLMIKNKEFYSKVDADQIIAIALKCLEERMTYTADEKFSGSMAVKNYLKLQLSHEKNEIFAAMFMDNGHRLLAFEKLFCGTVNEAVVYPRVMVQKAMQYNASRVIVAHNHPSGVAEPSSADKTVTEELNKILRVIDVRLLDHIVVTGKETFSFAENGLM
jgi:DNA repair protein RadC